MGRGAPARIAAPLPTVRLPTAVVLAAAVLAMGACGETGGAGSSSDAASAASAGEAAPHTLAAGTLAGPDEALDWRIDTLAVFGGVDAPDWAAFQEVTALAFDGDGRLYILDGPQRRLVVTDSTAGLLGTVGAAGEGPGEFRAPARLGVASDGAVRVYDAAHGALLDFGPPGAAHGFVDQYPLDEHGWIPSGPLHVVPAGAGARRPAQPLGATMIFAARSRGGAGLDASRARADGADGEPRDERAVVAFAPPDSVAVLYRGWAPTIPMGRPLTREETGGFRVRLPPVVGFAPELHVALLPDGRLAVADSTTWTVRILDLGDGEGGGGPDAGEGPGAGPDGAAAVDTVLARPISPTPVTGALRDAEKHRRLALLEADPPRMVVSRQDGGSATVTNDRVLGLERARIDAMGFHDVIPVIQAMAVDPEGRIWVQRHSGDPGDPGAPGPVDVLTPGGRYLGTLPPDGPRIPDAFGPDGLMAVVSADGLGAPVIVILRILRLR